MVGALRRRKPEEIRESIARWRLDLRQIDDVLSGVESRVLAAEMDAAASDPLGPIWWRLRILELSRHRASALSAPTSLWVKTWLQALAAEQWTRCDEVIALPGATDLEAKLADPMTRLTAAMRDDEVWNVPDAAGELLDADLPSEARVKLGVLRARALLYWFADHDGAGQVAAETLRVAPRARRAEEVSSLEGLAIAVEAEVRIEQGELGTADQLLGRALKAAEPALDAYLAAASLAMAKDNPSLANDLYDEAIARFTTAAAIRNRVDLTKSQLLRPVPANLLWRLSRKANDPEAALALLDRAIDRGILGVGPQPAREALSEKAELLKRTDSPAAGAAYHAAGVAFSESGAPGRARELLKEACQLAPEAAEHHWSYADALREQAVDADGVVDAKAIQAAAKHLAAGFELRMPKRSEAWVLLSAALIAYYRKRVWPDDDQDPSLLCERALLLDPESQVAPGFLATFLRLAGLPRQALEAATEGLQSGHGHPYTAARQVGAKLDLDDYEGALADATKSLAIWPDYVDLILQQALAFIRLEQYSEALGVLIGEDERLTYLRAGCLSLLENPAGARAEARASWKDRDTLTSSAVAAWSAFQCGELNDAIALQTDLLERSPADSAFRRDLGQMLLARGNDEEELNEGERLLREGIASTPTVHDLVHMKTMEFELLRQILPAGRSLPVLDDLARAADERIGELRSVTRQDDDPSELAAQARTAMSSWDPETALDLYERLCRDHQVPEARLGLERAAQALLDRGDRKVHDDGDLASANADWRRLAQVVDLLDVDSTVHGDLTARLAFAGVELEETPLPTTVAALARRDEDDNPSVLEQVFQVFARDVPSWWTHRDALVDCAKATEEKAELTRVIERLPMDSVYRLRRDAVPEPEMLPFVSPIDARLDAEHAYLRDNVWLGQAIGGLRADLIRTMGVQIPGVRIKHVDPAQRSATVRLYDQVMARSQLDQDAGVAAVELHEMLECTVRAQLYRLIVVDDIPLWLRDWDPTGSVPDGLEPPTPGARLRVARVLRLLLREHVPVVDRKLILEGCLETENSTMAHGPMDTLRVVRRRLGAHRLGLERGTAPLALPAELEQQAATGLNPDGSWAWSMNREPAARLIADLRDWLDTQPAARGVVPIEVADHRLRPFVWRLLATEAARIRILAAEELP